jgi:nitrile hydratase subunit beta
MDGVHDLGGREGFGPVQNIDDNQPFHSEWEMRAFGLAQSAAGEADWSLDWFRYCRELIEPLDYLSRPYFDQWMATLAAQLMDAGYVTLDEIKSGKSEFVPLPSYAAPSVTEARAFVKKRESSLAKVATPAMFSTGDVVRCKLSVKPGHTRLPGYVRGRMGTILTHHGGHLLPDESARGEQKAEHLYSVRFAATELWSEARAQRDVVIVDLWESYIEPV